jgi:hypothetical protein
MACADSRRSGDDVGLGRILGTVTERDSRFMPRTRRTFSENGDEP